MEVTEGFDQPAFQSTCCTIRYGKKTAIEKPLTNVRREILESLANGEMLFIDKHNCAWLGDRHMSQTRFWLTENRLVERKNKEKAVDAAGNGFVISKKGQKLLEAQPIKKSRNSIQLNPAEKIAIKAYPSERQLEFAVSLELEITPDMDSSEVSDLIDCKINADVTAVQIFKDIAEQNNVPQTRFVGGQQLRNRIFLKFSKPTREKMLLRWFAYFVMLDIEMCKLADVDIWHGSLLAQVVDTLGNDLTVIKSVRVYEDQNLLTFGRQVSTDGVESTGASRQTIAYRTISDLLKKLSDPSII